MKNKLSVHLKSFSIHIMFFQNHFGSFVFADFFKECFIFAIIKDLFETSFFFSAVYFKHSLLN